MVKILPIFFLIYLYYCSAASDNSARRIVVYERDHLRGEKKYTRSFDVGIVRSSLMRKDFGMIREGVEYALMDENAFESSHFLEQPKFVEIHVDISKDRADSLFLLLVLLFIMVF